MRLENPKENSPEKWYVLVNACFKYERSEHYYLQQNSTLAKWDSSQPENTWFKTEELAYQAMDAYYYKHKLYNCMRKVYTKDSKYIPPTTAGIIVGMASSDIYRVTAIDRLTDIPYHYVGTELVIKPVKG